MYRKVFIALVVLALAAAPSVWASHEVQFTGFPDTDPNSGKFVNLTRGLSSLGEVGTRFALEVPGHLPTLELMIFDGDAGGFWDPFVGDETVFTLFADPDLTSDTDPANLIGQWHSSVMPDNDWFVINLPQDYRALSANGNYTYNLVAEFATNTQVNQQNNFKVAVKGQVFGLKGSRYGFIGYGPVDPAPWVFPATTYDGSWEFDYFITQSPTFIEFWNGDFDYEFDTNDPNSPAFPPFPYASSTQAQGARPGRPADASIFFEVTPPDQSWVAVDNDPSGDREWEVFRVGLYPSDNLDVQVPTLPLGRYDWRIYEVDGRNTLFIYASHNLYSDGFPGAIGDFVWHDENGDGIQNDGSDSGIGGVAVSLWWDSDGNGTVDTLKATMTTDTDGYYHFDDLPPGTYEVFVDASTLPSGMVQTYDLDDATGPFLTPHRARVVLGVAEHRHDADFGYRVPPPSGGQGCTPGYWRQPRHFGNWVDFQPTHRYNVVFSVPYFQTLLQAVTAGGGGEKALGRHAVAALLNAASPKVNYLYTVDQVIAMVQSAYATGTFEQVKNLLEAQNEMGCPL